MYSRLVICHIDLITKLRPGDNCNGWSATNPWMVTHHSKDRDGHPPSPEWSPISLRLVTHNLKSSSQILSPSFPRMVTHDPKHGHPPSKVTKLYDFCKFKTMVSRTIFNRSQQSHIGQNHFFFWRNIHFLKTWVCDQTILFLLSQCEKYKSTLIKPLKFLNRFCFN